jgi:hypothetical protein
MGAWALDTTAPEGATLLFPLAWSPLLLLASLAGPTIGLPETVELALLWIGLLLMAFPLWRLMELRPLGRRNARNFLVLGAVLAFVPLLTERSTLFPPALPALVLWLGAVFAVHSTMKLERWVGPPTKPLALRALGWHQDRARPDLFLLRKHGVEAVLRVDDARSVLDLRGSTPTSSAPNDLGLRDLEQE